MSALPVTLTAGEVTIITDNFYRALFSDLHKTRCALQHSRTFSTLSVKSINGNMLMIVMYVTTEQTIILYKPKGNVHAPYTKQ